MKKKFVVCHIVDTEPLPAADRERPTTTNIGFVSRSSSQRKTNADNPIASALKMAYTHSPCPTGHFLNVAV